MDIKIYPGKMKGTLTPPPSKSYLHRAIISASMAQGRSIINNILIGEDIQSTIEAFRSLGVDIEYYDNQLIIESKGQLDFLDNHQIHCHESGSTMRFLMPLLTNEKGVEFYGESSLLNRPLDLYEEIYAKQKNEFVRFENHIYVQGVFKTEQFIIEDNTSSQYISGLLFALPLLDQDSTIELPNNFQSIHYIDMTIDILNKFNIKIEKQTPYKLVVPGKQKYKPASIDIESDYSQAAFFMVGAAINGDVIFKNIHQKSIQPDKQIIDILKDAGASIEIEDDSVKISKTSIDLSNIDLSQNIDLGPILFLLASQSKTPTTIKNVRRLIYKESNRLKNMLDILNQMGVQYILQDNQITIDFINLFSFDEMDSYNDHRIAMSIAIFSTLSNKPTIIKNMHVMNKSYPTFVNDLKTLKIQIDYIS